MKGFKVFILPDPCFIQCVMHVVRNSLILPGEFYSSHTQLSVSILRRRTRRVFYIFTFKMGAIKTDRPVRINTRVPVTLCSLKPNQKITNLPLVFINMLLSFHLQKKYKTIHWPNRYFTKVWISYAINTSRTAYRLNRTIKFS